MLLVPFNMKTTKAMKKLCKNIGLPITSKIMDLNIKHLKEFLNNMCCSGNVDKVKLILNSDILTDYGKNILYFACSGGSDETIKVVDKACARIYDSNVMNNMWYYGLIGACGGGHFDLFIQHLDRTTHSVEFWNACLFMSCETGNIELTNIMSHLHATDWNKGMHIACKKGYYKIVELMIYKGADQWAICLEAACYGGDFRTVELIISKGADILGTDDWNKGLKSACEGRELEIVELMIEHGATKWNYCLESACYGGNMEVVELIFNNLYNINNIVCDNDLCSGLIGACEGGNINVVKFMMSKGATNWDKGMRAACKKGRLEIFKLMLLNSKNSIHIDDFIDQLVVLCENNYVDIIIYMIKKKIVEWSDVLDFASSAGNLEIVELAINKGATNFNGSIRAACQYGHIDIVELLLEQGADNFNECLASAYYNDSGDLEIIKLLISKGATDWNKGLEVACSSGDLHFAKFLIEKGATDYNSGLEMACEGEHKQLVQLMLLYGVTNLNEMLDIHANIDYNKDIIIMLINAGANDLQCLVDTNYFKFYCMYCKYAEIRPDNEKYLTLLCKYPAYVLLVGSRVGKNSSTKRLPAELFRLLFEY